MVGGVGVLGVVAVGADVVVVVAVAGDVLAWAVLSLAVVPVELPQPMNAAIASSPTSALLTRILRLHVE